MVVKNFDGQDININESIHMKMKAPYNIYRSLLKVLPIVFLMGTPAMNSCKPDDTSDLHITGIATWNWNENLENAPTKEYIQGMADNEYISEIHIVLHPKEVPFFTGANFHAARNTLQKLIDINPDKIKGSGEICPNPVNGASLPFPDSTRYGMAKEDSIWFCQNGWHVWRMPYTK